jgi:hypothetical protein
MVEGAAHKIPCDLGDRCNYHRCRLAGRGSVRNRKAVGKKSTDPRISRPGEFPESQWRFIPGTGHGP